MDVSCSDERVWFSRLDYVCVCVHNNIKGLLVVSAVFCIEGALFGGRRSLDKVQAS